MVIVRIQGGLGNQLFQLAAARELGLRLQADVRADLSWFVLPAVGPTAESHRHYLLPALGLAPPEATAAEVRRVKRQSSRLARWLGWSRPTHTLRNPLNGPVAEFFSVLGDVYLTDYWQGEAFFSQLRPVLAAELGAFRPGVADTRWVEAVRAPGAVAVHVRRGDFVSGVHAEKLHRKLPLDHYVRALAALRAVAPVRQLVVFSDDIAWCRDHLGVLGLPLIFVDRHDPDTATVADLVCMAQASALIIANSTFSWWAAWIAAQRGARVAAPAEWFNAPDYKAWNAMLVVPGWVRV